MFVIENTVNKQGHSIDKAYDYVSWLIMHQTLDVTVSMELNVPSIVQIFVVLVLTTLTVVVENIEIVSGESSIIG